jgi:hypothetical protein
MGWGALEEFGSLFSPGMRHEQQEKQRLELTREDPESGGQPLSTVDLDGNKAVIRLPPRLVPEPEDATGTDGRAAG